MIHEGHEEYEWVGAASTDSTDDERIQRNTGVRGEYDTHNPFR